MNRSQDGTDPPFSRTFLLLLLVILIAFLFARPPVEHEPRWADFLAVVTAILTASAPLLLALYGA